MCFAVEQENARLVLSLFIHEILSTRLTLWDFTSRFRVHQFMFRTLLFSLMITIIILSLGTYIYIYMGPQLLGLALYAFRDRRTHGA